MESWNRICRQLSYVLIICLNSHNNLRPHRFNLCFKTRHSFPRHLNQLLHSSSRVSPVSSEKYRTDLEQLTSEHERLKIPGTVRPQREILGTSCSIDWGRWWISFSGNISPTNLISLSSPVVILCVFFQFFLYRRKTGNSCLVHMSM